MNKALSYLLVAVLAAITMQPIGAYCADSSGNLRVVAKTGTLVGGRAIGSILPGVSINNRGTIAFAARMSDGEKTILAGSPDGELLEPRPGGSLVNGYGVQINDADDIAFIVGPGISSGFDYCIPADPPAVGCKDTLSSSEVVYSLLTVNAFDRRRTRSLFYSYVTDAEETLVTPRNGPWTSLGSSLSLNNLGQISFLGDISANRNTSRYALGLAGQGNNPSSVLASGDALTRPMLGDNGSFVFKETPSKLSPILVGNSTTSPIVLADTASGFDWLGQYPGMSDSGHYVAFTGSFIGSTNVLPTGEGLFLSALSGGAWITHRVLDKTLMGTNVFSRFHDYYRTCVAELANRPDALKICFGATSISGRFGIYAVTYDARKAEVLSLETIVEAGRDILGMGPATSFELFDSINRDGEVVIWLQTANGDAVIQAKREIAVVDPLPDLVDNSGVIGDLRSLATATNLVNGLAADGVTRVLLRVETPGEGVATFQVTDELGNSSGTGWLSEVTGTSESLRLNTTSKLYDGKWYAFAVLRAPTNFARVSENDASLRSRPLTIRTRFALAGQATEEIARKQIQLHRPPVVLLHGIWSEPETWKLPMLEDPRFVIVRGDYKISHAAAFKVNVPEVKRAIAESIAKIKKERRIAAVQADFVGHSMGGLLARLYVAGGENGYEQNARLKYQTSDNYGQGDIHKLITLATPHQGLPPCNLLLDGAGRVDDAKWFLLADAFENVVKKCVSCGAVSDLRTYSDPIKNLPRAKVPSHAILATGGPAALQLWRNPDALFTWNLEASLLIPTIIALTVPTLGGEVFGSDLHDTLVPDWSQAGNLPFRHTTSFAYDGPGAAGLHTTVTREPRVGERIVQLLNSPITDQEFSLGGFPENGPTIGPPPPQSTSLKSARSVAPPPFLSELRLLTLVDHSGLEAGNEMQVTVVGTNGYKPIRVLIMGPWGAEFGEIAPFSFKVLIPSNWIGQLPLQAIAVDAGGLFAQSQTLTLDISTTAIITNIVASSEALYLYDYAHTKGVRVFGEYSDGVQRALSSATLDFYVIDETVASVSADGLVEAHGLGQTTLWVRNGAFSAAVPIFVLGSPFTNPRPRMTNSLELVVLPTKTNESYYQLTDMNNRGQILMNRVLGGPSTPFLWESDHIAALSGHATSAEAIAVRLTESGIVAGASEGPGVWLSTSNFVHMEYTNGPVADRWYGALVDDLHDGERDMVGLMTIPGSIGEFGNVGLGSAYRFEGNQVGIPIVPNGPLPPGYNFAGVHKRNRAGTLIGSANKVEGGAIVSTLAISLDSSDAVTTLNHGTDNYSEASDINNRNEIVGAIGSVRRAAVLWTNGNFRVLTTGEGAIARHINNLGHVAIESFPGLGGIWDGTKVVLLKELFGQLGWSGFGRIYALNDNGWLVATAGRGNGDENVLIKLAPHVRDQPIGRTKVPGQSVKFEVAAFSFGDTEYQWRRNGVDLVDDSRVSGARSSRLNIENLQGSDAGDYSLRIQDSYGLTISSNANLRVLADGCLSSPPGLVALWTGDETFQEAENRFTLQPINGPAFGAGIVNGAFVLDGTNDMLVSNLGMRRAIGSATSFEAWVYPTRVFHDRYQMLFSESRKNGVSVDVGIDPGTDRFSLRSGQAPGFGQLAQVTPNQWQHIAVVVFDDRMDLYKNGVRFTTPFGAPPSDEVSVLTVGNRMDHAFYFQGMVDEIAVYDRGLTQAEIQAEIDVDRAGRCRPKTPPTLLTQPQGQAIYAGSDLDLAVEVRGAATVGFQWLFNGRPEPGLGSSPRITLVNISPQREGDYSVIVSNAYGMLTSQVAHISVKPPCEEPWVQTPLAFGFRNVAGVAYDKRREVAVYQSDDRTWELGASGWRLAAVTPELGRYDTRLAYDEMRGVVVLFGGYSTRGYFSDTWEWDGVSWALQATGGPKARAEHTMWYDPTRGTVLMFGGAASVSTGVLGDLWEWDGIQWTEIVADAPYPKPEPRRAHSVAYDASNRRAILYGGADQSQIFGDTWAFEGGKWAKLLPLNNPPPGYDNVMAYHPLRQATILFSRPSQGSSLAETWELQGLIWARVPIDGIPEGIYKTMVYHESLQQMIRTYSNSGSGALMWSWSSSERPRLELAPTNQTVFLGQTISTMGCALGRGPLSYAWYDGNGRVVSFGPRLSFEAALPSQSGSYHLVVTNGYGSVTSAPVNIVVLPCNTNASGVVAWWRGQGDGKDLIGTNNFVLRGGHGYSEGKVNLGLDLDGEDDYAYVATSPALNLGTARGITVEGWIKVRSGQPQPILEWNRGSGGVKDLGVHFWTSNPSANESSGHLYVNVRDTSGNDHVLASPSMDLTLNEFHHVAFTYDRPLGLLSLCVNGRRTASATVGTFRNDTAAPVILGGRVSSTNFLNGVLDEFAIYNRALAEGELAAIYSAGSAGKCEGTSGAPYVFVNDTFVTTNILRWTEPSPPTIALLSPFAGWQIDYTVDATSSSNGIDYLGPFAITDSSTIRASAASGNGLRSPEARLEIVFDRQTIQAPTLRIHETSANRIVIGFVGFKGIFYDLVRSEDLSTWASIIRIRATESQELMLADPNPPTSRAFYRVIASP